MTKNINEVQEELMEEYGYAGEISFENEDDVNFYFTQPSTNRDFKVRKIDNVLHSRTTGELWWQYEFELFERVGY